MDPEPARASHSKNESTDGEDMNIVAKWRRNMSPVLLAAPKGKRHSRGMLKGSQDLRVWLGGRVVVAMGACRENPEEGFSSVWTVFLVI